VQSVEENMKKFIDREVKDANKALRWSVGTDFHTPEEFKLMKNLNSPQELIARRHNEELSIDNFWICASINVLIKY